MATASLPSSPQSGAAWGLRLATFALWVLAGASLVYWGLRLTQRPLPPAAAAAPPAVPAPDAQALGVLLGVLSATAVAAATAPEAVPASRFALVGVVAGRRSGGGAALIAVDGKPPKPYRVGAQVEPGLVLQSVGAREAHLGAALGGPSTQVLSMPVPPGGTAAQR
ncbi:MAG: general secretion pathway protein C [Comamonadaceae bacterium SCN 68-20]|nr:MAG: general secretion pathway protein C [Comamonadaceae bacterium SCN 68-20]OJX34306.1 MAG: general secretion pathway protein C [Burkholderiales bacterium 68-20]UJB65283.1 general secretion pathway protein C [Acidovorax sp. YS12]